VYGPPAIPDLKRAGIIDEVRRKGLVLNTMCWRNFDETLSYMTGIDAIVLADVDGNDWRLTSLALQELDQLMLDMFLEKYNGQISWKHRVVSVHQDAEKAWVQVETPDGPTTFEADYVVGCDGAGSTVRKSLFGKDFPGFTWDSQVVATNVSLQALRGRVVWNAYQAEQTYYDFDKYGFKDINFIIHPEHFYVWHFPFLFFY
jgi:2-polyprenyl-6-methoxyphenol hydroxylase-like FAD-dependent oxidoreductase